MRVFGLFTAAMLAVIAGVALLAGLLARTPADHRAVWVSAAIAAVVQLFTFGIVRIAGQRNRMAGWGMGALLRFVALGVYGLLIVTMASLPAAVALLSLAAMFFLSTLIEPLFLKL